MSISAEKPSSERPAEIGPPPYYHRSDCNICRKQDGLKTGSELLDAPRPGGYVVEGEHFLAEHAPLQESSAGTVIVEARRHLLDFGEMTPAELAEIGSILNRLVPAIKAATGVQRVYYLAVMILLSLRRPFLKDAQFGQPVVVFLKPLLFLAESREDQAGLHHVFRRVLP